MALPIEIRPIGRVRRMSDGECVLELNPALQDGLLGVEAGARLDVLYWMHKLDASDRDTLQVHPRGDRSKPLRGVFCVRSPMRPNPIGVTEATVVSVEGTRVRLTGLDAMDGAPIIDVKSARRGKGARM